MQNAAPNVEAEDGDNYKDLEQWTRQQMGRREAVQQGKCDRSACLALVYVH